MVALWVLKIIKEIAYCMTLIEELIFTIEEQKNDIEKIKRLNEKRENVKRMIFQFRRANESNELNECLNFIEDDEEKEIAAKIIKKLREYEI